MSLMQHLKTKPVELCLVSSQVHNQKFFRAGEVCGIRALR